MKAKSWRILYSWNRGKGCMGVGMTSVLAGTPEVAIRKAMKLLISLGSKVDSLEVKENESK